MTETSAADEIAFAALPADVQALARRVVSASDTAMYDDGYSEGEIAEAQRSAERYNAVCAERDALRPRPATAAFGTRRVVIVGQCCIDAYALGWDECTDEYQAQRVPSNHDVAARIAESRDDDGDAR